MTIPNNLNTQNMETITKGYNSKITVNNVNLTYDDVGEGNTPVIFLHGYPFDKTMWQLQLEVLKPSYRLIALDIRGFGKSKNEESPLRIDAFSDDVIALMDGLQIEKAIVCGLSMGGYIALNALQRFPDRFVAMVLCDTQCIADTAAVKEKRFGVIDEIAANGPTSFLEGFIKKVFHKDSLDNKKELVKQIHSVVFANSEHVISQGLVALAERSETCSTLQDISIPVCIICGRQDEVTPLEQSEWMHKNIKGSSLKIIENAGHLSNLEQPDSFNKYLGDFLDIVSVGEVKV